MPEVPQLEKASIPSCLPDALRGPLTQLARAMNWLLPLKDAIDPADPSSISLGVDDLAAPDNVANPGTTVISSEVVSSFFIEGILQADLTRDGTATINLINPATDTEYSPAKTKSIHGYYVPTDKKVPANARIGAQWNGVKWRAKITDKCVVNA